MIKYFYFIIMFCDNYLGYLLFEMEIIKKNILF